MVLHHQSSWYKLIPENLRFKGPTRVVIVDDTGDILMDLEIPGRIKFLGERDNPSRPLTRPLQVHYNDFLPRRLDLVKGRYIVLGYATVIMTELRLSAIGADFVELCRDPTIRKCFAEANPNEVREYLLRRTQPLNLRRIAALFRQTIPEDLRDQTLLLHKCYLKVKAEIERAFANLPRN